MSQDHMALLLGVSRSLYSMFELRQRSLPTRAMLKYAALWQAWQKFETEWQAPLESATPQPSDSLLFEIKKLKYKQNLAKYALKNLDKRPDYPKAKAFFEQLLPQSTDQTEQVIFNLQIRLHEEEGNKIKTERDRLLKELELIEKRLEVLERGLT